MRVITINLNGIRSASRKGFFEWLKLQDADFVCVQELKAQEINMTDEMVKTDNLQGYFSYALKPGYSGVGIYSKKVPLKIIDKVNFETMDHEGRYIELIFDNLSVISTYLPSGSSGDMRQQIKFECLDFLKPFLEKKISSNQNVILCGDLNIAHQEIDLKNHKGNKKNSGFLPEERDWIGMLINKMHWVDAYRQLFPLEEELAYTWWSNRGQAWSNNVGWRIDYQMTSSDLSKKIHKAFVFKDERFSDHAPLIIDYDFEL